MEPALVVLLVLAVAVIALGIQSARINLPFSSDRLPEREADDERGRNEQLRAEARVLVERENERRAGRGEEPLDVESEIDRRLGELGA